MSDELARIETQGAVVVERCALVHDTDGVKVVSLSLATKYAQVDGYCGNSVHLGANERTIHVSLAHEGITEISFPRYEDYDVLVADVSRYACDVVLTKRAWGHYELDFADFDDMEIRCD